MEKEQHNWIRKQNEIRRRLSERGSKAPIVFFQDSIQTKIILERSLLQKRPSQIEFHKQYPYDFFKDKRACLLDSDYENIKRIKEDFISCSLNLIAIQLWRKWLREFDNCLISIR